MYCLVHVAAAILEKVGQATGVDRFSLLWAVSPQLAAVGAEPKVMATLKRYPAAMALVVQ